MGDGSWINIGYYNTLKNMGFTEKVAATALRQANNSLNTAVQLLQEEPELIQLAVEERSRLVSGCEEPSDEMLASVISLGYEPHMAKLALKNEGSVESAVEALMEGGGVVVEKDKSPLEKRRRTEQETSDKDAYDRIKDGIEEFEEDHLDLDLVEEGEYLEKYL